MKSLHISGQDSSTNKKGNSMLTKTLAISGLFIFSSVAFAGELVKGATILEVASSASNKDVFYIQLSGGTGPCANGSIIFPAAKSQSKESHNQAFSIALAAVTSSRKVRVHNYENDSCYGANFIGIYSL